MKGRIEIMGASGAGTGDIFSGLLISVFVILVAVVTVVMTRKLQARQVTEVLRKFGDKQISGVRYCANFFGQESLGYMQVRGIGVLVLTEDELFFEMLLPKREFRIAVASIHSIETPKSHLGKTKGRPLFKVIFQNEKGQEDSMAWSIKDLYGFKEDLDKIIKDVQAQF